MPVAPEPFVAPTLTLMQGETAKPLDAEVIFIKASAVVGKSTIASHLSSLLGQGPTAKSWISPVNGYIFSRKYNDLWRRKLLDGLVS
jgi:pantothenate kinase